MNYIVKFKFNCLNKNSSISGKSGEVDITTDSTPAQLMESSELIEIITAEMERKTKRAVLSVDITEINEK